MDLKIVRRISDLPILAGTTIGFVPTMGAFHEGHLELMRRAKQDCGVCVVSLFVNPTQFGKGEDFTLYPRDEKRDFELANSVGVDVIFSPSVDEMYARRTTHIHVLEVSERWEGAHRPGHFDGVATVVAKLFHVVQPTISYFGLKDLQQCAVVRRMVEDLNFSTELRFIETVRESDGLAMSSRNAYLSPDLRAKAPQLFQVLSETASEIQLTPSNSKRIESAVSGGSDRLQEAGFDVDYFALVDETSMEPVLTVVPGARLMTAARLGPTRLIDNHPVYL